MRVRLLLLMALFLTHIVIDAPLAGAGETEEAIADAILAGEVWVEDGSDVDQGELEDLRDEIASRGYDWGLVALAYEPDGGADQMAEDVLALVRGGGGRTDTIVVLGLETIDGDSRMFRSEEFLDAVVGSLPAFENNYIDGYAAIFENLTEGKDADVLVEERAAADAAAEADESIPGRPEDDRAGVPTTVDLGSGSDESSSNGNDDGGSGGFAPFAWLLGLGAAVVGAFSFFSRRKKKKLAENGLEKLRSEVKGQVSLAASRIVELDDQDAILSEESQSRFGEATATYHDVRATVNTATTHQELDDLGERMDVALWQFDLTEAELKGAEAPEKPEPRPDEPTPEPSTTTTASAGDIPTGRVPGGGYNGPTGRSGGSGSYGMGTGYGRGGAGYGRRSAGGGLGSVLGGVLGGLVRGGMRGGGSQRRGGSMGGYTSGQSQPRARRSSSNGFPGIPSSGRSSGRRGGSTRSGGGRRTVGRSSSRSGGGRRSVGRRR